MACTTPLRLLPPAARPTRSAPRPSLVTAEGRYDGKAIMDLAHTLARDDVADAARRGRTRRYKVALRDALEPAAAAAEDRHEAGLGMVGPRGYGAGLVRGRGGRSCRSLIPSIAISGNRAVLDGHWMASTDVLPLAFAFPADDEVEDARWLASLITTLQTHAQHHGHPEVAIALDDALKAAQAIVDGQKAH